MNNNLQTLSDLRQNPLPLLDMESTLGCFPVLNTTSSEYEEMEKARWKSPLRTYSFLVTVPREFF